MYVSQSVTLRPTICKIHMRRREITAYLLNYQPELGTLSGVSDRFLNDERVNMWMPTLYSLFSCSLFLTFDVGGTDTLYFNVSKSD